MKSLIKGMIIFFAVTIIGLIGLLVYALVWNFDGTTGLLGFYDMALVHTQKVEIEDLSDIYIKNYSSDIFFLASESDEIIIKEYVGKRSSKESVVTVSIKGGMLYIESNRKRWGSGISFGSRRRLIEISLPEAYAGALKIDTSSGEICAEIDFTVTDCKIQTSSGDVSMEMVTADNISIQTSSGDVHVKGLDGRSRISTQSGGVRIGGSTGDTDISSSSGSISLAQMNGTLNIRTSSGEVETECLTGSAKIRTTSGDVNLAVEDLTGEIEIECSSGEVYCELPQAAQFQFQAKSSSGKIKTDFDNSLSFSDKGTRAGGRIGTQPDVRVMIKTTSGDISCHY